MKISKNIPKQNSFKLFSSSTYNSIVQSSRKANVEVKSVQNIASIGLTEEELLQLLTELNSNLLKSDSQTDYLKSAEDLVILLMDTIIPESIKKIFSLLCINLSCVFNT